MYFGGLVTRAFFVLPIVSALAGAGCGGGPDAKAPQALKVTNPFPTKDALDKLARTPAKPMPARAVASVPEWRVDDREVPESSLAETRLAEASGDMRFTRELRCVARELGRLRAENGADADERVQRFILGACGITSSTGVSTFYQSWADVSREITDEQLFATWKGKLPVPPSFKGKAAGAWLTRKGKQAILMVVAGQEDTGVTISRADDSGRVTVQGMAPPDVDYALVLVNQGRDGVARCEPDRSVILPRFSFTCSMAEGDPWTWIEVATRTSGGLLLRTKSLLLARRDPQAPVELGRLRSTPSSQTGGQPQLVSSVLDEVNRARTSAKLAPLTFAPKQSSVNARVAPHFFSAETTGDGRTGDLVALGLLAGWDVEGTIQNGGFFSAMLSGAKDPSGLIDYALEHPMGRFTLLEPTARQIALGAAPLESVSGLGVVLTTYSFFGAEDHQANSVRVLNRLAQERAARRLPPATSYGGLPSLVNEARLVNAGQREPMAGLDNALSTESQRIGQSLRGWAIVTNDLDILPFPNELLAPGPLAVRVVVTHYRPENSPWGMYLIYFVAPAPTQQQVAEARPLVGSAPAPRSGL